MDYKLTYFPVKGRGEIIRILLSVAGVKFEDERISGEDWVKFKPECPMKSMPVLQMTGRPVVCQTNAICRYLAKKYGFYGKDPFEDLLIDEVVDTINDLITEKVKSFLEKDEAKKAELDQAFIDNIVPKFLDYLRLRMRDGKNGYIVGDKLTWADMSVFNFINIQKENGATYFDEYDDVMRHYDLVKSNKNIAKWLDERPPN